MERKDRAVLDSKGNFLRWSKRNKIPIPYQKFINEIALVFLYGRPVKWTQLSENTDYAYSFYKEIMREIRFDSCVRQAKRAAGAEGIKHGPILALHYFVSAYLVLLQVAHRSLGVCGHHCNGPCYVIRRKQLIKARLPRGSDQ